MINILRKKIKAYKQKFEQNENIMLFHHYF
jgi:hypothetical protein